VEASNTPTIRRLTPSRRHQLSPIAPAIILNILARRRDPAPAVTILTPDALRLIHEPQADCARYDTLRRAS
jgi:hypothetical protein